jgi:hypothetical protein
MLYKRDLCFDRELPTSARWRVESCTGFTTSVIKSASRSLVSQHYPSAYKGV